MKATWPNQERRRGRSNSPEASRRGQRPLARYLTPGLPRRRAPSGVNFPPPGGGPDSPHPREPVPLRQLSQEAGAGPPRSIHNLRPGRRSPPRRPPGSRGEGAVRWGRGCGTIAPQGCGPAPSPETAMHHGSGAGAARRRQATPTPGETPARAPHAHAPSPQPRPRGLGRASGGRPRARGAPGGPARRHRGGTEAATHTPSAMFEAAGRGALRGRRAGGGAQPRGPRPLPEQGQPHAPAPPAPLGSVLT